jgi:CBS domain-containing protein
MKVRDIMTPNPRTAELDTTLEEIATLMKEEDVGAIPVMEDGRVTGVVTDRDIVLRCIAAGKDPTECTAEDIMTEGMNTIEPDANVDEAADLMAEAQVRRLAVVQSGRLVGMLSLGDIAVKAGDEEEESTAETLEEVSKGVKGAGRQASGREDTADFEEESEFEMAGSGARRQRAGGRENWSQGEREAGRGQRERGSNDREAGRMKQSNGGRGSQQPGVRGREQRDDRREESRPQGRTDREGRREQEATRDRGRVQQTGATRRTSERGRPEKVGHGAQGISMRRARQGAQGISNRAAGRENARQQKVAPKRAEARGNRNAGRRRAG